MDDLTSQLLLQRFDSLEKNTDQRHQEFREALKIITVNQKEFETHINAIYKKINEMAVLEARHVEICPVRKYSIPDIEKSIEEVKKKIQENKDKQDEEMLTYRFFLRNPQVFFGTIAIGAFLFIGAVWLTYNGLFLKANSNKEEKQRTERVDEEKSQHDSKTITVPIQKQTK